MVGGEPTTIENFPYIVALTYTYTGPGITVQRCVGCLLSSWHVMTSGFCFTLSGGFLVGISRVIKHPDYLETPRRADMAINILGQPLAMSNVINVLYLPPQDTFIPDGQQAKVIGGPQLEILKTINLFKLGLAECQGIYSDKPEAAEITEMVGISSYFHECGNDDVPDVFTRVDTYTDWILGVATAP
ncbi:Trypsin, partial [Operophtera brumata]